MRLAILQWHPVTTIAVGLMLTACAAARDSTGLSSPLPANPVLPPPAAQIPERRESNVRSVEICERYVGQAVAPQRFEAAVARFASIANLTKGEFETTATYNARKAAALRDAPRDTIIIFEELDRKSFQYDADAQRLYIQGYALNNVRFAHGGFVISRLLERDAPMIAAVISMDDQITRTYDASNAFGATVQVAEIQQQMKAVFDRGSPDVYEPLFPTDNDSNYIGGLPSSPSEAKKLKETLNIALVVTPKEPFIVTGRYLVSSATFQDPRDVTEHYSILIADIQCGLLMDGHNKVLQAYPTR